MKTILLLLSPFLLSAQGFSPVFRNYTTEQGLPNNWVYGIRQDRQGYIWVSTDKGVCRFDGYTFHQFPDTLYTNHTSVLARNMTEDDSGRLWYLDFQNHVFYIERERIVPWKHNHLLDSLRGRLNDLEWFVVKGTGAEVLMGARDRGILRITDAGAWAVLPRPGIANYHIYDSEDGYIVCPVPSVAKKIVVPFTGYLLPLFFQNEHGSVLSDSLFFPGGKVYSRYFIGKLQDGAWLYFWGGYVYCLRAGKLEWSRRYGDRPAAWAAESPSGHFLVGHVSGGGLDVYNTFDDFRQGRPAQSLLPGLSAGYIFIDREGGCWIGTQERGIFYCPAFDQGRPDAPEPLREGIVKSLDWDRRNTLYAGTSDGKVFALDLRNTAAVRDISPPDMPFLDNLYFDTLSQILAVAGAGQPSAFYQKNSWQQRVFFDSLLNRKTEIGAGSYVFPGRKPDVWLTNGYGCMKQANLRTRRILRTTRGTSARFYIVRSDQSGRIWASTRQGLVEWVGDSIAPAHHGYPALRQRISDIELLPDTSLVLCPKGHGVVIWKPGRAPLEINTLHCAPGGIVWACSDRGLNKLTPDGRGGYRVASYTVKQGLPSNTVYDALSIGDTVWVATHRGLFRMFERPDTSRIPAPVLAGVSVNNALYFPGGRLNLPYDSADVALEFVALHFRSNGQIPYAFRLLESEGDTAWTYTADRRVNFSNLAPGRYRFEVKAGNDNGAWSAATVLDMRIRPPWWATWWARAGAAAALGLLAFGLYRYRLGQVRAESRLREEMLRLEQSALQAQMNPHFIFNCLNSIQNFILNNESDAAVLYLAKFAKLVRGTLNASVAGVVSLEEEVKMLDNYLALERLRFKNVFDYRIDTAEIPDPANTLLPPLIVQPFVENAVLHGMKSREKDGHIAVTFRQTVEYLGIEVQDNGSGMNYGNAAGTSLGRSITQRRLELIGRQKAKKAIAVEYLVPEDGVGTRVSIRLPNF